MSRTINKRTSPNFVRAEVAGFGREGVYAAGVMGKSEEKSLQSVLSFCHGEGTLVNQAQRPSSSSTDASHQ